MNELQLKKLEAYGFKSFADKLDIVFNKGITAIVGPNGSGKSNITDAIRWVLGEQNVRNLRGSKTEDVIFTGSATRRALGFAEVSLTFDNCDGTLPIDFQEVVVTRRLFRSGDSEYSINKAKCRLKDIHDLFADTGLGRDAISVISQNNIDQVLNSRPEERRLLFEEAAGITKYRNRKKETLKKLNDTEQNLLRVNDIIAEIENQLEPLAQSAEKTRAYQSLYDSYRRCKLTLLLLQYESQQQQAEAAAKELIKLKETGSAYEVQINLCEVDRERFSNEFLEVEKSLALMAAKNSELGEAVESNNREIALNKERLLQRGENELRLRQSQDKLAVETADFQEKLHQAEQELLRLAQKVKDAAGQIIEFQQIDSKYEAGIKEKENLLAQVQAQAAEQSRELIQCQNNLSLCKRDLAELSRQSNLFEDECNSISMALADKQREVVILQSAVHKLEEAQHDRKKEHEALTASLNRSREAEVVVAKRLQTAEQSLQSQSTRLKFLQGLQEEYEGFGRGVKRVLKNKLPWSSGVCGAVAEVIKTEEEYIIAVEIALGGGLQNVITEDDATAKAAIAFLKQENLGRVTFLPLNTVLESGKKQQDLSILRRKGIIGYANDLVSCAPKYRQVIDFLLARTIVAADIDTALAVAREQRFRVRIVTLDGDTVNPGGSLSGGSLARRESGFLNRAGEIEALTEKIRSAETAAAELRQEQNILQQSTEALAKRNKEIEIIDNQCAVELAQKRIYCEKAVAEGNSLKESLAKLTDKIKAAAAKELQLNHAAAEFQSECTSLEEKIKQQSGGDTALSAELAELAAAKEHNSRLLVEKKIAETVVLQEEIRAKEQREQFIQALNKNMAAAAEFQSESEKLAEEITVIRNKLAETEEKNDQVKLLRSVGLKDYDNFHQVKLEKLASIQGCDQELKSLRKKFNLWQEQLHAGDLTYTKYRYACEASEAAIRDEYQMSIEEAVLGRLREDATAIEKQVRQLESEIELLGPVNPQAVEEYEALYNRYTFITRQADDLVVAKEYLLGIIKEMDITMAKQFSTAFVKIGSYFEEIFQRLFGGGQAKLLLLEDENVLESGIEIQVQSPNKKLQSLAVLSGGERALTVIALLFAFLRFRPAPFTVVDEIDAPLDEANVDRFGEFLQEYAENTQFIVVTHRKGTMQAADVLYGVTVEDSGVSRIISVQLEEQAE